MGWMQPALRFWDGDWARLQWVSVHGGDQVTGVGAGAVSFGSLSNGQRGSSSMEVPQTTLGCLPVTHFPFQQSREAIWESAKFFYKGPNSHCIFSFAGPAVSVGNSQVSCCENSHSLYGMLQLDFTHKGAGCAPAPPAPRRPHGSPETLVKREFRAFCSECTDPSFTCSLTKQSFPESKHF